MIARKDYICDLCALQILAGTVYFKYVGKPWDACGNLAFFTLRYHPDCEAWVTAVMTNVEEWTNDDLRDKYREQSLTPQQARRATNSLVGARRGIAARDERRKVYYGKH